MNVSSSSSRGWRVAAEEEAARMTFLVQEQASELARLMTGNQEIKKKPVPSDYTASRVLRFKRKFFIMYQLARSI